MTEVPERYEILIAMGDRETLYPDIPFLPNQRILKSYGDSLERAILTGFSHAKGSKIVVMDGDGSHPPELIPQIIKGLDDYQMVVPTRNPDKKNANPIRSVITTLFTILARLKGSNLSDPMSGYFAIKKELIEKVKFRPIRWKTCLEIELATQPQILEIPYTFGGRVVGKSKANFKTGIKLIYDLITM